MREQQYDRNQHGADRIDVLQRVQRQPPEHQRRAVAEEECDPPVRDLVQGDGKKHRDGRYGDGLQCVV